MQTEILLAVVIAHEVFRIANETLTLTSCTDGDHKAGSLHHTGRAVDLRLPIARREAIVGELKNRLGDEYDVVLEVDHIHVEYDP
jgi:hypothetical protein